MADDAPSALDWLREQLRRKGEGEAAPGIRGLRVSRGLAVALVLAVVVIILVLTSKNGGTPAKSAANSASPSASSDASPAEQADRTPNPQSSGGGNAAKPGATTKHSPSGTTGYTRQQRALFLREKPDTDGRILENLPYDTEVTLICHTEGPSIYGMNGRASKLWDKVRTGEGKVGYIPDEWVATQSLTTELVEAC
ncbi:hypothetical protein GCM10023205_00320 [Yinghuangia aomiensis]|uniref:SH3b domain-containing protein n=1 Tax=Yinghuangia aomiensis TaxID=676205 RepID=A0ABP9GIM3_9ACTN